MLNRSSFPFISSQRSSRERCSPSGLLFFLNSSFHFSLSMARVLPLPSNVSELTFLVVVVFDLLEELLTDFHTISILFKLSYLLLLCLFNQLFSLLWIFGLVDCPKVSSRRKIRFIVIWKVELKVRIFFHYLSVDSLDIKAFVVRNRLSIGVLIRNSLS